jgi:outer membrane protein TolC
MRVKLAVTATTLVVLALLADPARAGGDDPLPSPLGLEQALAIARAQRPEIRAAQKQAEAAAARPDVVDSIDDPMLMTAIDHLPLMLDGADLSAAVEVTFPMSGILGDRRRAAEREAERLFARADRVALDVELEAATAFLMLYEARRLDRVLREQATLAAQLRDAANARLSAAAGSAAEVLRVEMEVARANVAVRVNRAARRSAAAMLNAALGRRATARVPKLELHVETASPPATAALVPRALGRRPELREAEAAIARARAEVDVMEAMYGPMGVVRFGPGYTMADGLGFMVMLGVSLPLDVEKKRAGVREAQAMAAMAEAELEAMENMIGGEVASAREAIEAQRERLLATREEILPAAQAAVDASIGAYASGELPLVSVIEGFSQLWAIRLDEVRAEVALGSARARLVRAVGGGTP